MKPAIGKVVLYWSRDLNGDKLEANAAIITKATAHNSGSWVEEENYFCNLYVLWQQSGVRNPCAVFSAKWSMDMKEGSWSWPDSLLE